MKALPRRAALRVREASDLLHVWAFVTGESPALAQGAMTDTCRMRVMIAALFLAGSCVACGGPNYGTPRPSDGPAFAAINQARTEVCGQDVCVSQDVVNMGNRAGIGECRLEKLDHLGGGRLVKGPTVTLPIVAPGETTTVVGRWKGAISKGNVFTVECDPPPLM